MRASAYSYSTVSSPKRDQERQSRPIETAEARTIHTDHLRQRVDHRPVCQFLGNVPDHSGWRWRPLRQSLANSAAPCLSTQINRRASNDLFIFFIQHLTWIGYVYGVDCTARTWTAA